MQEKRIYIFSALNRAAAQLAGSMPKKTEILFAETDEQTRELFILPAGVRITLRPLHTAVQEALDGGLVPTLFLINEDEDTNLQNALSLNAAICGCEGAELYCWATSRHSEHLIDALNIENHSAILNPCRIRRVHPAREEVYMDLWLNSPFDEAVEIKGEKWINTVIIGYTHYALEMLKGLLWCCQMDGYYLRVDIFDSEPHVRDHFAAECPGIIERGFRPRMGEDYYDLRFHGGTDVHGGRFLALLDDLPEASRVLCALEDENENIALALDLRTHYAGILLDEGLPPEHSPEKRQRPRIQAVVHSPEKARLFAGNTLRNFRGQHYQIESLGSDDAVYSSQRLFNNPLHALALEGHLRYGSRSQFEMFEYFRRSSMASVLHLKYRNALIADQTVSAMVEHRRWNAYMRSTEGYRYGIVRDDLAKRHPSLTAYDNLSQIEQAKDFVMNSLPFTL